MRFAIGKCETFKPLWIGKVHKKGERKKGRGLKRWKGGEDAAKGRNECWKKGWKFERREEARKMEKRKEIKKEGRKEVGEREEGRKEGAEREEKRADGRGMD